MKKIIILILLIPTTVFAETIYTEYEEYKMDSSEFIEESDIIKREEYKIYNTYVEQIEEVYKRLEKGNTEYIIDYNDFIIQKEISLENNDYVKNYEMKCLDNNKPLLAITLDNFSKDIKISEMELIFNNELVGYGTNFTEFQGLSKYLFDKNIDDNSVTFKQKTGKLYVGFMKRTSVDNLTLKLHFPKQQINKISFNLKISNNYEQYITINLKENQNTDITISFDKNYNNFLQENNFSITNNCISYYNLEIPKYKHTKINIVTQNNYKQLNDKDLFLLYDYKIKYNYFKREKIEITDNIILKNSNFNFKDYLISSTIPLDELIVNHNINYDKSGIYYLNLYYKDSLLINKEIKYEKEVPLEKDLKIESTKQNINNNKKNIQENIDQTTTTTNKINSLKNKSEIKKITQKQTTTTHAVKKLNAAMNSYNQDKKNLSIIIISILIILLTIFEIILLYVKRKYY